MAVTALAASDTAQPQLQAACSGQHWRRQVRDDYIAGKDSHNYRHKNKMMPVGLPGSLPRRLTKRMDSIWPRIDSYWQRFPLVGGGVHLCPP